MSDRLGDAPIQPEYHERMNKLARALDQHFNGDATGDDRKTGFILLVFKYGIPDGDARCNFISNGADRKDVVVLFKEMIARFEGQPQPPTGHA